MSIEEQLNGIRSLLEILDNEDLSVLHSQGNSVQPWNNLTAQETKDFVEGTFELLDEAFKSALMETIPFNILNGINNHLSKFNQQFQQAKGVAADQLTNQHHNALNQLQAIDNQIRASGIYSILKLGPDIDQKSQIIDSQVNAATKASAEFENLASQVRTLLDPAVAGALSHALDVRRVSVSKQKWFWFAMLVISGGVSIWLSIDVTNFITGIFKTASGSTENIGFVWFLRLLLLVPAYFFIGFSVSQFLRERRYEESYAHKSSIAQTLPSYSELIASPEVKDEITSSATKVVFTPPYRTVNDKGPKKGFTTSEIKEITDLMNVSKLTKGE